MVRVRCVRDVRGWARPRFYGVMSLHRGQAAVPGALPPPESPDVTDRTSVDADVATVARIAAVPRILDAVVIMTGMRFAAVARVTEASWIACAVRDELAFGLLPGGELELESTICNEIRQHHQPVVFGHASAHAHFSQHHTPKRYGLESYISVPIFRSNGMFFGTLCAIDSRPTDLDDPVILKTFQLFAELIGLQLEIEEDLTTSRQQLQDATRDSALRDQLVSDAEREIRDLFQPIVTGIYLLRTSATLDDGDRDIAMHMNESVEQISRLLRAKLDHAYSRLADPAGDESTPR